MKVLIILAGFCCMSFILKAQQANRAIQVPLNLDRTVVYDSLFLANDWRKELAKKVNLDTVYGKGWMSKMLKIGESAPDLDFRVSKDGKSKKNRFSNYRGKLVILDFWSTFCSSCIESFPEMQKLQKKFGDQIQIILVNTNETEDQIRKRMGKNISKIPDLPSIVDAKYLFPYFPCMWVPYHVWIDQNGTIRVIGGNQNTYEKKIIDLLNGKDIVYWQDECTRPSFNPTIPYAKILGLSIKPNSYNSIFTSFNNDYAPKGSIMGSSVVNRIDSVSGNKRSTFINYTIEELYIAAFKTAASPSSANQKKYIFNPHFHALYEVRDSSLYSWNYLEKQVDTSFIKSMFCYEQISPLSISIEQARQMMVEDLNSYFGKMYGTHGRIEKRLVPGYEIVKLPGERYKLLLSKRMKYENKEFSENKKKMISYQGISFNSLFYMTIRDKIYASKKMLVNETGITGITRIDIDLPVNANLLDIKQALKRYGLDIIEKNVEVELLVISDTKAK